jgi:Uma2 family endonuclease
LERYAGLQNINIDNIICFEWSVNMETLELIEIDISHIVTEDDTPVDNLFSEHQQTLLKESLLSHWKAPDGAPYLIAVNVGVFYGINLPPIAPDAFVSFGVTVPENFWEKRNRSYFVWEYGKPPEIVIEVVSNLKGGELDDKLSKYAAVGASYYVVYDPAEYYGKPTLRVFALHRGKYVPLEIVNDTMMFEEYGLGIKLWSGLYGSFTTEWLRWCFPNGELVPTGAETQVRLDKEISRADRAEARAEGLAAKLRALGISPNGDE